MRTASAHSRVYSCADTVNAAGRRRRYGRRRNRHGLSKRVPDGLGPACLPDVDNTVDLRPADRGAHLGLFAHLPGSLAQRAIQQGRVATGRRQAVDGGPKLGDEPAPRRPSGTNSPRRHQSPAAVDHRLHRQAEDCQTDAGRRRQLRRLLRAILRGTNVGRMGQGRAI